mgnify:CR=1 FL=1
MKKENVDWLDETGKDWDLMPQDEINSAVKRLAADLINNIQQNIRNRGINDSGKMVSDDSFGTNIISDGDKEILELFMVYYADYVNKGVKGWGSSKNAPNSPYQFKSKGMSEDGRKSIMASIQRGKLKLTDTSKTKVQIGLEKKYKNKIESQADRMIWLIKKYGIKQTAFLDDAIQKTIKEFKF